MKIDLPIVYEADQDGLGRGASMYRSGRQKHSDLVDSEWAGSCAVAFECSSGSRAPSTPLLPGLGSQKAVSSVCVLHGEPVDTCRSRSQTNGPCELMNLLGIVHSTSTNAVAFLESPRL